MATITKRGENWRVQIRRRGAKPIYKTFSKKILAEKWASEMELQVEAGKFAAEDPDFGVLIQRYIDEILPIKPMQRSHEATMRNLKRRVLGTRVSQITAQWMLDVAQKFDCGPSTRAQYFIFLAMVLKTADTFWEVRPNWDEWKRGRHMLIQYGLIGRSKERSRRVTNDDVDAILDCMQSSLPMEELIGFAIDSCVRLGELVRITWGDLDEDKRTVVIRDRKHPRLKQGNHQTIPLLGRSFDIVKAQVRQKKEIFPYNPNSISAAFHRAVVRAGIVDMRWHDLRHEGICRLFEAGYEIQEVAMVSGHADWNMLRRYTHLKPESLHRDELDTSDEIDLELEAELERQLEEECV